VAIASRWRIQSGEDHRRREVKGTTTGTAWIAPLAREEQTYGGSGQGEGTGRPGAMITTGEFRANEFSGEDAETRNFLDGATISCDRASCSIPLLQL